jgi:hypothetical protein
MRKVWKFPARPGEFTIVMPDDAWVLAVQMQGDSPYLWALCDTEKCRSPRRFVIAGTGHPLPDSGLSYIATFQMPDETFGVLVWHVFEKADAARP